MEYTASSARYKDMHYRRVGKSGLKLPSVSLGLWQNFGDEADYDKCREMLLRAFDLGITHFDLANNYGPPAGAAERLFGKVLKNDLKPYRDEMIISTKSGYYMWEGPYGEWGSRKQMLSSLDQSLQRMGLDYVDIFYHHRPDPDTPIEESMGALKTALESGKALYVGISNYDAQQTQVAIDTLKKMGVKLLIHQPRYNMFDRRPENGLYATLDKNGVGAIPFSPLQQGILTDRYLNGIPADSRAGGSSVSLHKENITEDVLAKVRKLNDIAQARGQKLSQMALSWLLNKPQTSSVLIGASKISHIEDAVKAQDNVDFTQEELDLIDAITQG
ncbi:MAG: aldo/keto reductase [Eubacteriales bacterium]|nr:aldo/keto reductase [Eubacteriales bacterium]